MKQEGKQDSSRCLGANAERQQMRVSDDSLGDAQGSEIILRQHCFDYCGKLFFALYLDEE